MRSYQTLPHLLATYLPRRFPHIHAMINAFAVMGLLLTLGWQPRLSQPVRCYAPLAALRIATLKSEALMVTRLRYVVMHANLQAFARMFAACVSATCVLTRRVLAGRVLIGHVSAIRFATTASNSYILNYDSTQERSQH